MDAELPGRDPCTADLHHPPALIEAHHLRATEHQLLGVEAGPARRVQNPPPVDISEQLQARRPVQVGVVEPVLRVAVELVGEDVVLRRATHPVTHGGSMPRAYALNGDRRWVVVSPVELCTCVLDEPRREIRRVAVQRLDWHG